MPSRTATTGVASTTSASGLFTRRIQRLKEEPPEHDDSRLPVSIHRRAASGSIASVGPRAHTDHGRKAVAHEYRIGPESGRPAVPVRERMYPDPLGVSPSAHLN